MKALILVGGFGTRLRPLTLTVPKPLVEFGNKPIICHQIEALIAVGVSEVVLAINYRPEIMEAFCKKYEAKYGIKITISQETEPMGTAGPLALANHILNDGEPFFVLNSDVTCTYPLKELLDFHVKSNAEGTILVTTVEDPSKYGVVLADDNGKIDRFVEKPKTFVGNRINAGIYCLSPKLLARIKPVPTSIEKDVFPVVAAAGGLYSMLLPGFWMDIGQPKDYLTGMCLYLEAERQRDAAVLASGAGIKGNVLIDAAATVGEGCVLGPDVVIAEGCVIEDGVRLSRCTLLKNAKVKKHALVANSIIGWDSTIGAWSRVEGSSVLGEDVQIKDELYINGAIILPHKGISLSIAEPQIIM